VLCRARELSATGELELHARADVRFDALLLLRHPKPELHHAAPQARALARQRLADLRPVARRASGGLPRQLATTRVALADDRRVLWAGGPGRSWVAEDLFG